MSGVESDPVPNTEEEGVLVVATANEAAEPPGEPRPFSPPADATTEAFPSFASSLPRDPRLTPLLLAFERGDFRSVRSGARSLRVDASVPDATRDAATKLYQRTSPSRLSLALLGLTGVLFFGLALLAYGGGLGPAH